MFISICLYTVSLYPQGKMVVLLFVHNKSLSLTDSFDCSLNSRWTFEVLSSFQVFFSLVLFSVRIAVPYSIRRYGNILLMSLRCLKCFVVPQPLLCSDKLTMHLITGVGILLHLIFSSCFNLPRVTESHITFLCVSLNPGLAFRLSS